MKKQIQWIIVGWLVCVICVLAVTARAADEVPMRAPAFLHRPPATAKPGSAVIITGVPSTFALLTQYVLFYRNSDNTVWQESHFLRLDKDSATVAIPFAAVEAPGVDYCIYFVSENTQEPPIAVFASKEAPHRILVHGLSAQTRYKERKEQVHGRLSRIEANYGYTYFGNNLAENADGDEVQTNQGNFYQEANLAYEYRILGALYGLRMEVGGIAHNFADFKPFTASQDEAIGPGMYYLSPAVMFEFAKYFGATALVRIGISEEGFEGGGGTSIRIGRIDGTRLDLGIEGMSHAGWRAFFRFEWDTVPYVPMSFNLERTQWYAASSYAEEAWGNRMYYEARVALPNGLGFRAHAGFASRDAVVKAGFVVGGGAYWDF